MDVHPNTASAPNCSASATISPIAVPGLSVDLVRRKVLAGDELVELTAKEFEVLALLASQPARSHGKG